MIADDAAHKNLPVADHVQCAESLRRIFLSAIPVVAAAAEFDLSEIGVDYIPDYADHEFPVEA